MANTIYKTDDGWEFSNEADAQRHANDNAKRDAKYAAEHNAYDSARANNASGNYEAALASANTALSLERNWRNYLNRGIAYANLGRFDEALADYNEALGRTKQLGFKEDIGLVLNNKGVLALKIGEKLTARAYFEEAADLGYNNAVQNLAKIGKRYAPCNTPTAIHARELRRSVFSENIGADEKIANMTEAINLGYQLDDAYMNRGVLYYKEKGDKEAAIADLKKAADYGQEAAISWFDKTFGIPYELGSLDPNPGAANDTSSSATSGASTSTGEPQPVGLFTRVLQVGAFLLAGAIGGGIIAFIASWFFGRRSIPTELIRVAANVVCGVIGYQFAAGMLISNPRPQDTSFSQKLLKILIIVGIVFFLWNSKLPPPQTTIKRLFGTESVKPAAPQTATAQTATVTADALNFRAEPSGNATLVKTLKKGDTLNVTGEAQDGWVPVEHSGDTGWVNAQYLNMEGK